ncbi:unnamed protein product [Boreogadus saida]
MQRGRQTKLFQTESVMVQEHSDTQPGWEWDHGHFHLGDCKERRKRGTIDRVGGSRSSDVGNREAWSEEKEMSGFDGCLPAGGGYTHSEESEMAP